MNREEFFDRHAEEWDSADRRTSSLRRVVEESALCQGHFVLDVGTGTGVLIPHVLPAIGARGRMLAVDVSRKMLAEARDKFKSNRLLLARSDAHSLCVRENTFDRVICNAAFPHFEDRELSLREMVRALRPDGMLVVSHPIGREAVNARHREFGGPVVEDRVPPPDLMAELLRGAGVEQIVVIDEPDFYLARGRKPR